MSFQNPLIVYFRALHLVGVKQQTTLKTQNPLKLWSGFKPRVGEVIDRKNLDFYSVQVFNNDTSFASFTPDTAFEKWAAVEVNGGSTVAPEGMDLLSIRAGRFAVFLHRGLPSEFPKTVQLIFEQWLPNSGYILDPERPHFEVMDAEYRPDDPNAIEEVWVPIQEK